MHGSVVESFRIMSKQRRASDRRRCNISCHIETDQGRTTVIIENLSETGCGLRATISGTFKPNQKVTLIDGPLKGISGLTRWVSGDGCGVEFEERHLTNPAIASIYAILPKH